MKWILCLLLTGLLIVPMEFGIRRMERRYGRNIRFVRPMSNEDKLDWFLEDLKTDNVYDFLIIGSSACMYGVRPDIFSAELGNKHTGYNVSFSGASFFAGLQTIHHLRLAPKLLVVCVSPFNFTRLAIERDRHTLAHLDKWTCEMVHRDHLSAAGTAMPTLIELAWRGTSSFLRVSSARYRAGLLNLASSAIGDGSFLSSLNRFSRRITASGDTKELFEDGRYYISYVSSGFVGLVMEKPWNSRDFEMLSLEPLEENYQTAVFPDYRANSSELFAKAAILLQRLQSKGTKVIFVRLPQFARFRTLEDRETDFNETMMAFAERQRSEYLDTQFLCQEFVSEETNFRDPVHLHDGSAGKVSKWIASKIAGALRR